MPADLIVSDSNLNLVLDTRAIKLVFSAAAAGTAWSLITSQTAATNRVWAVTGNASYSMTTAIATGITQQPYPQQLVSYPQLTTNIPNLITGMVTYFTAVPAAANGAFCLAFAIGGMQVSGIAYAQMTVVNQNSTSGVNSSRIIANSSGSTPLPHDIYLNGSNAILLDGSGGSHPIAYGTNTLLTASTQNVLFGSIAVTDASDVPASTDLVILELILTP